MAAGNSVVDEDDQESVKSTPLVPSSMVKFKSSPDPRNKGSFTEHKTSATNLKIELGRNNALKVKPVQTLNDIRETSRDIIQQSQVDEEKDDEDFVSSADSLSDEVSADGNDEHDALSHQSESL